MDRLSRLSHPAGLISQPSIAVAASDASLGIPPLTGLAIARHFMRPLCGLDGCTYKWV